MEGAEGVLVQESFYQQLCTSHCQVLVLILFCVYGHRECVRVHVQLYSILSHCLSNGKETDCVFASYL